MVGISRPIPPVNHARHNEPRNNNHALWVCLLPAWLAMSLFIAAVTSDFYSSHTYLQLSAILRGHDSFIEPGAVKPNCEF